MALRSSRTENAPPLRQEPAYWCVLSVTASPNIGIGTFTMAAGSDSIRITSTNWIIFAVYDLIWATSSELIQITGSDSIRLPGYRFIRLAVYDWIWLSIFYSIRLI